MRSSKRILAVMLILAFGALAAWASGGKTEGTTTPAAATGKESPMLAALVKAGKLPPLKDRLPKEPLVIKAGMILPTSDVALTIGKYGGQLRIGSPNPDGGAEFWAFDVPVLHNMPGVGNMTTDVIPWFLKSYAVDPTGKIFTFGIREGVKWSDGIEITTDDVKFWWNDYILNKELTPSVPLWLAPGGTPAKFEVVDKYTFKLTFAQAYGSFLVRIGSYWFGNAWEVFFMPYHWLKDYHVNYAKPEELKAKLKEANLQDNQWALLFTKTIGGGTLYYGPRGTIGLPTMRPWVLKERPSPGVSIFERNPYYFAVDEAGNQLPYIDTVRNEVVTDSNGVLMKAMTGELDLIAEAAVGADMPLLKENESKGNYKALPLHAYAEIWIFLNYGNKDREWAKIAQNPKFRLALSTAMNRKEFVKAVYNNLAAIPEWAPAYDLAAANKLLDEIGLNKRDSDGWRLRPDGKRMEMLLEFPQVDTGWTKKGELAAEMWKAVGIYSTFKVAEYGLWDTRSQANELYATIAWGHSMQLCSAEPLMVEMLLPFAPRWPPLWNQWYSTGGKQGEEPTMPEAKQLYGLIDQIRIASGNKERVELLNKVFDLWHNSSLFLVDAEKAVDPWVVSAKLGNTPTQGSRHAANAVASVFYFK